MQLTIIQIVILTKIVANKWVFFDLKNVKCQYNKVKNDTFIVLSPKMW
jgi:hypothetical protein